MWKSVEDTRIGVKNDRRAHDGLNAQLQSNHAEYVGVLSILKQNQK